MSQLLSAYIFGGFGIIVLLLAAELFVSVSTKLALAWRISPLITSLIIVALGTNVPEFAVSIGAIIRDDPGLALGNLIGSSASNISFIFGAAIFFGFVKPGTVKTQINAWMLLGVTVLFCGMSLLRVPHALQALYLLATILGIVSYQFILGIKGRKAEDKARLSRSHKKLGFFGVVKHLILLALAIALVWLGGNQVVVSLNIISLEFGISTTVLGLTLAGMATTLPELLTALTASFHRQNKVAIGTVLGSNIFNLTLFPAIVFATAGAWNITGQLAALLFSVTLLFSTVLVHFRGRQIPRYVGLLFIAAYGVFLYISLNSGGGV
ncbi:MAG: hypothetical protein O2840_04320 [bacterium]|nr:hypothetical protein [bacterium]